MTNPPLIPQVVYLADGTPAYMQQPATGGAVVSYQAAPAPVVQQPMVLPAAYQPAPLVPVAPTTDQWPARLLCGGVGVGAAGVGVGFMLQALAAATTGLALLVGALGLVWLLKSSGSGRSGAVTVNVTTHNRNRNR